MPLSSPSFSLALVCPGILSGASKDQLDERTSLEWSWAQSRWGEASPGGVGAALVLQLLGGRVALGQAQPGGTQGPGDMQTDGGVSPSSLLVLVSSHAGPAPLGHLPFEI